MRATAAPDQLYPLAEAAEKLRIAPFTLRGWCLKGKLPYCRVGNQIMLLESDLEGFIRSSRIAAK